MEPILNTPIETHLIGTIPILVKREDLCTKFPHPPFSKMRGLWQHLVKLKEGGVTTVGYTETSISMAGWGVAAVCAELGLRAVIYDPQYKETPSVLQYHRKQWKRFSPVIVPVKAGRAKVNFYTGRKHLHAEYSDNAVMLELGIPLEESVKETAAEYRRTIRSMEKPPGSIVVNVGSGTICAGIVRGWEKGDGNIYGVMGRTGSIPYREKFIAKKAKCLIRGLMGAPLFLVDPGWEYTEKSTCNPPFPSHPYYDAKAWEWLMHHTYELEQPILFWNIGRMKV